MKINRISPDTHEYLQILTHIAKVPKRLNYIGALPELRVPSVAIVGTRKPTRYGREVTEKLAGDLARIGVVIVSGLALGVDSIAHQAALHAHGTTLAVLANGLPTIYPATHKKLAENIIAGNGAIITEYDDYASAKSWTFLERNRIVAGLSDAVIITEAASRSGTLNTAMHALEQGKEVFVVPGPITSPMSVGCHQLLKQGASLVTSVDDILEVIAPDLLTGQASLLLGDTPLETKIIALIASGIRDGDELQRQAESTATELSTALTMLELAGSIRNLGANQWTIR